MLKRLIKKWSVRAMSKEFDEYLEYLKVSTASELALILATASMARKFLRTSRTVPGTFPEGIFRGTILYSNETTIELAKYNMIIIELRKQFLSSSDYSAELIGHGLLTFVESCRAIGNPELFAKGRQCWNELRRGAEFWAEELQELWPNISDEDLGDMWLVPNFLAPESWPEVDI